MRYKQRAEEAVAQNCLTNSKNPKSLIEGLYPTHIKTAHKAHIWDVNNVRYLDFICGLGTNFFGYGNDKINKQILRYLYGGYSHSLPTFHEVEAAEAVKELVPFIERVKFLKTGTEACMAAVRIARAYTGRNAVLSDGYHGWSDDFVSLTEPAAGVPARGCIEPLSLERINSGDIAAVIIEPVITKYSSERIDYLKELRRRCDDNGVVLIYDEVITGCRFMGHAVANNYGVLPDLICMGKAIANGMPLALVGGKKELMDNPQYFVSSTYAGEVLSLVACKEAIRLLKHDGDYDLRYLWQKGQEFINAFNTCGDEIQIEGYPTRGVFTGKPEHIAQFFQEMAKANVLFCKSWFFNWNHIDHMESLLDIIKQVKFKISRGMVKLEYPLPASPFAQKVRENGDD